ncbi:MAG TPA: PA14 domain-containing protein [Bryobacteraceae bacterium]|jgi:hypothetical protein|nr:PA14 domain-containing protein [Bryobacteraceae bacterium]
MTVALTIRTAGMIAVAAGLFAQDPQEPRPVFGITVLIPSALQGRIYHIRYNTAKLPNFNKMKPAGTIYTTSLNIPTQNFRRGFPGVTKRFEWFAIDYTGRFWAEKPGDYNFSLTSDDGSKLYIDGDLIVDNDGIHATQERSGTVRLSRGVHDIRVSYFQGPADELALVLKVAPPEEHFRIFNTDEFKPPPSP